MAHRWQLTTRQLFDIFRSEYGTEAETLNLGPEGFFLVKQERLIAFPNIDLDEVLEPEVLYAVCRVFGIPAIDFGLDPDPDDD